jgi:hypothetical protein
MVSATRVTEKRQGLWLSTTSIASVFTFILFIVLFVG